MGVVHGPCDAPVQEDLDSFGFDHADLEGDDRALLVIELDFVLVVVRPCSLYAPFDLHGEVAVLRDRSPQAFLFTLFICHTLNPSPSAGRVRGLKGSTHLSPVHALHFGLSDWVISPAPRQLSTLS